MQVSISKSSSCIFEMRPPCALFAVGGAKQFYRLPFMDVFSLLCCTSATERHDELKIWLYVALAATVFVIFDKGAELIILELTFAAGLYLRQGAASAARAIRKSVNVITATGVMARAEGKQVQHRATGIDHVKTVAVRHITLASLQACFASLGLHHLCLASRLLPQPVSIARQ